jgi:hypothetical protein
VEFRIQKTTSQSWALSIDVQPAKSGEKPRGFARLEFWVRVLGFLLALAFALAGSSDVGNSRSVVSDRLTSARIS